MNQKKLVITDMVNEMTVSSVLYTEDEKDKYPDLSYVCLDINGDDDYGQVFFLLNKADTLALADELIRLSDKL